MQLQGGKAADSANSVLASVEKSPYAVTLHNVDQFEQLTKLKVKKASQAGKEEGIVPSEEYLNNLRQSFNFSQIPQSMAILNKKNVPRNPRKEDNTVLHARMQNQRLWQLSSKYKSLQKITVSSINEPTDNPMMAKLNYSQENMERTRKYLTDASQQRLNNKHVKYF